MKIRWAQSSAVTTMVLAGLCLSIYAAAQAQSDTAAPLLYNGFGPQLSAAEFNKLAASPTPRTKDGHSDLTGYWGPPPGAAPSGDNYGSTNLSADTWLDSYRAGATIHSANMHVTERFTRRGNTMQYQITIEDTMFAKPWIKPSSTLILSAGKHTREDYPCISRGADHHEFNADSQGFELDPETLKKLDQVRGIEPKAR